MRCLAILFFSLPALAHEDGHTRDWPAERLEIATDTEGIINTDWAGVPDHFGLDVGLLLGYENNPLYTFTIPDGRNPLERKQTIVEHRFMSDLTASIALFNWLQFGIDLPLLLGQSRDDATAPELDQATPLGGTAI